MVIRTSCELPAITRCIKTNNGIEMSSALYGTRGYQYRGISVNCMQETTMKRSDKLPCLRTTLKIAAMPVKPNIINLRIYEKKTVKRFGRPLTVSRQEMLPSNIQSSTNSWKSNGCQKLSKSHFSRTRVHSSPSACEQLLPPLPNQSISMPTFQRRPNDDNRKRSKSTGNYEEPSFTVCAVFPKRKTSFDIRQANMLDSNGVFDDVNMTDCGTNPIQHWKSTTQPATEREKGHSSEKKREYDDHNSNETVYAVYDSNGGSPRLVSATDVLAPSFITEDVSFFNSYEGFQDIDLALDPNTIDISIDDFSL